MHRPNVRGYAAELVHEVAYGGRSLDRLLNEADSAERDRPLLRELTIGSVRHFLSLSDEVSSRLHSPLKTRDSIVLCLLIVGAYQLRHTRIPAYAIVNETVGAARQIGRPWARGLINQVLRRVVSESNPRHSSQAAALDHPQWLIDLIRNDYPDTWQRLLSANLTRAPLSLRVNLSVTTREAYLEALAEAGFDAHVGAALEGVVLAAPSPTAELPGLASGWASVQDSGAMWAAHLLAAKDFERVLDACAAPGGKALHLLERAPHVRLTALDIDSERCDFMQAEFRRRGVDPDLVVQGDGTRLEWWDGVPFQRILLDAPCSGTGTLRRHPDIKLLKCGSDIDQYHNVQNQLLGNLWRTLAPRGHLLYCTCSVLSRENDDVIEHFVSKTPDVHIQPIDTAWGAPTRYGRQILPAVNGSDGFFYAMLEKRASQ